MPPPQDGKLEISTYTVGDTVVSGMQVNTDESVTFTRGQLQQLLEQTTRPHITLPPLPGSTAP